MKTYKYIIVTYLFCLLTLPMFGQTLSSLLVGSDSRSYSIGGATVGSGLVENGIAGSSGAGAFALENNVAPMSLDGGLIDAAISFGMWQPEYASDKMAGAGATWRITRRLAAGILFKYMIQPEYQASTGNGTDVRDGLFSPKEMNVGMGVSFAVLKCLSVGASIRVVNSVLAPEASSTVFGADIGLYFNNKGFSAGLSVNNLGNKVKYGEKPYSQPMLAKVGAGYSTAFGISSLSVSAEYDVLFNGAMMAGAGVEYGIKEIAFMRAGYHYGDSCKAVPSYASVGLGVKFWGVHIDASYLFASKTLNNSFSISLGYRF